MFGIFGWRCNYSGLSPSALNCRLHSVGGSRSRSTPMPRGRRPSNSKLEGRHPIGSIRFPERGRRVLLALSFQEAAQCLRWVKTGKAPCEHMFSALPLRADIAQRSRHVRFVPKGDVTPVYSITPSTVASNLEGSFRPNVLAVLSRRFSLSVPYWLPWTFVHLQRGGADDEDDFGTNPK